MIILAPSHDHYAGGNEPDPSLSDYLIRFGRTEVLLTKNEFFRVCSAAELIQHEARVGTYKDLDTALDKLRKAFGTPKA